TEAETVLGQNISIKVENGKVYINNSEVIITDIVTSNGVIHVIDTVLLP
ncbi:MAG: fasciclin domain-containing protein, partial [Anaerolineaceae bacterium]|nr:fasciclin domain-containing protein [Anaerolineaceae bacterium]